ncbi:MAG: cytochrome c3 family protein [Myxococcota bacterium]
MARVAALALALAGCGAPADAEQPIPFNHAVHVVERKMACVECHEGVLTQAWAGMPSTDDCLRCHAFAFTGNARALEAGKKAAGPDRDPWVRLYAIAPHAQVSHAAHVKAGVVCEKCHGDTGKSVVARRELMLEGEGLMYWCMDCHAERKASLDCVTCHR